MNNNPLLDFDAPQPRWSEIHATHLEPALDQVLAENRDLIAQLETLEAPTWNNFVQPLEEADNRLHRCFGAASHLHGVCNTSEWRQAYEASLPKLTAYGTEVGHNAALFQRYRQVAEQPGLSTAQRSLLDKTLRDFRLSGVDLAAEKKSRFQAIQQRLAELSNMFERHLVDHTDRWEYLCGDATELNGLPEAALARAAQKASDKNREGYLFGLDFPSFDAVMTYADDRSLRRHFYHAYATRASTEGSFPELDNSPLMVEILQLRQEESELLGFANFAELSLASKMAESPAQVEDFLLELARKSRPAAERELQRLEQFAQANGGPEQLEPWDMSYYAQKLKQELYGLDDEQLRPYLPLPQVLDGMFAAVNRLFEVSLQAVDAACWHSDVLAFEVRDAEDAVQAWFYLDPYARDQKRGGAWMDDPVGRMQVNDQLQRPVATLTCNFSPPLTGQPALLTHDEAVTLFHEFGHGLQHMLTRVDELGVSGINGVPWDAVELASQFLENWCWEEESLRDFARHFETGEPIPPDWIGQIRASRVFNAGLASLRQVEFSLFDLRLHREPGSTVMEVLEQVRDEVALLRPPAWNRFPNSFGHIFAGGYAAGYYSYKWAEVLAADAYSAFAENGIFDAETGRRFRQTILEAGGSRDAMELFREFRGREPSVDALLKQDGLLEAHA